MESLFKNRNFVKKLKFCSKKSKLKKNKFCKKIEILFKKSKLKNIRNFEGLCDKHIPREMLQSIVTFLCEMCQLTFLPEYACHITA